MSQNLAPPSAIAAVAPQADLLMQRLVDLEGRLGVQEWWLLGRDFEEAGARPRNPTMEDRTAFAGHDVSSPILEPMWDEPMLQPEEPDDIAEVLPGTAAGS